MNRRTRFAADGGGTATSAIRTALMVSGLVTLTHSAVAQVQRAGDLFVDIDATSLAEGPLPSLKNNGTLGGFFVATGAADTVPSVTTVGGTKGITFDGIDYLQLADAVGGSLIPVPDGLVGEDPTRSIEAWVINSEVAGEETLVSWGKRGGPDGTNISFNYGSDYRWGAVGHWGGNGPDLGWNNDGGNPAPNQWHHLVYTFDGATHTTLVYVDGQLANGEIVAAGLINTHPDGAINIATQLEPDGITPTGAGRGSLTIAKVRIHDGVLTGSQIAANYNLEKAAFVDPAPPAPQAPERLTKAPTHRYTFSEAATDNATDKEFRDSVGTAHGKVLGTGAAFTGSRLKLTTGGASTDFAYGDLPNGLLSANGAANGGTGEFSIETWFKITEGRTWSRVLDIGSSTSDDGSGELIGPGPVTGLTGLDYLAYSAQIGDNVTSRRLEIRNEDPAGGGVMTSDVSSRGFGVDTHVLITWNESTGAVSVYEDGTRLGGFITDDKLSDINDVNVWLGRSNWTADQNTQGEYDEVRIYDRALTPGEVLGNYLAGPDLLNNQDAAVTIAAQPQNVNVNESLNATFSAKAYGSTPISFQWYRNGTAIPGATSPTYTLVGVTSADNGATFTVEASNTVNGTPTKVTSNPATLNVVSDTVTLKHRYSFNETSGTTVADSVGGKNGTLMGSVTLGGGTATLDGGEGNYIDLPNGLITALGNNGTIEFWVTYAGGPNWSRVFDFGISNGGEDVNDGGIDFLFYTAKTAEGFPRFVANFPDGGDAALVNHPGSMPVNQEEHVVISYNHTVNSTRMYTNGTLVATAPGLAAKPLSAMNNRDINVWLGRSQYADPYFAGQYNEFRIYSGAMGPAQVAASYAAGPNNLPAAAPTLSIGRDNANVRLTYTGTLESADTVAGPWTPVAGATSPATIPATAAQKYYRAKQ